MTSSKSDGEGRTWQTQQSRIAGGVGGPPTADDREPLVPLLPAPGPARAEVPLPVDAASGE